MVATKVKLPPGFELDGPVLPEGFEIDSVQEQKGTIRRGAEALIRSPVLPIAGAIAGGIAGSGLASIPLAGLGAAGGEGFRIAAARQLGMEAPPIGLAPLKRIGSEALTGAAGQALGLGAAKVLAPLVKPVSQGARAVGRSLAGGVEKLTGIPAESVTSVFTKPLAMFTAPTKKKVAETYAKSEFPEMAPSLDDILKAGTGSHAGKVREGAKAIKSFVEEGTEAPAKILAGRKALDKQVAVLQNQIDISKGAGKSALLQEKSAKLNLRSTFNRALDRMAPKLREADAIAAQNLQIAPFRNLTLPGKINITSPEGILRAVPGLPSAVGTTISGAGAIAKGIGKAGSSQIAKKGIPQVVAQSLQSPLKNLTDKIAKKYLRKALKDSNGDLEKARELADERAKKDGYDTTPK